MDQQSFVLGGVMDFQFAGSNAGKAVTVTLDAGGIHCGGGSHDRDGYLHHCGNHLPPGGEVRGRNPERTPRMFSGENFFLNHFTSHQDGSEIDSGSQTGWGDRPAHPRGPVPDRSGLVLAGLGSGCRYRYHLGGFWKRPAQR